MLVPLAPLLFSHMQNIPELSAPPVHYFPNFSFSNTSKKSCSRGRKARIIFLSQKVYKLILDVKIDHKFVVLIFAVDGFT